MARRLDALITIHDVAPDTLDRVRSLIDEMPAVCRRNLLLLVIPGHNWGQEGIDQLRSWQRQNLALAGHGWHHRAPAIKGWRHRLHALLISRNAAEHLALSREEILDLLQRSHAWFGDHGLSPPDYYVPPAWAMGAVSRNDLRASPFRYYESSAGIFDAEHNEFIRLPLLGFEADNRLRKVFLRLWNAINARLSGAGRPVRISLHPNDRHLLLGEDVPGWLNQVQCNCDYRTLFADKKP